MFLRLVEQHPRLMMRCSHRASLVGSSLVRVSWCRKGGRWRPHWKLLLVPFKSSALRNYAKEVVNVLFMCFLRGRRCSCCGAGVLTQEVTKVLTYHVIYTWSTSIEDWRRLFVACMGSNVSPAKIQRAGKTLQPLQNVCEQFEKVTAGQIHSDRHRAETIPVINSRKVFSNRTPEMNL